MILVVFKLISGELFTALAGSSLVTYLTSVAVNLSVVVAVADLYICLRLVRF